MTILIVNNSLGHPSAQYPRLVSFFRKQRIPFIEVDNLEKAQSIDKRLIIRGLILSGSPMMLSQPLWVCQMRANLYCLERWSDVPVLGICFGSQLLYTLFGGTLQHHAEATCKVLPTQLEPALHKPSFLAKYCYHDELKWDPTKPIPGIQPLAWRDTEKGVQLVAFAVDHPRGRYVRGYLFHPESLKSTHVWLKDFVKACGI